MKLKTIISAATLALSTAALADQSAVQFEVVLSRDGNVVSSPNVVAEFGKTVELNTGVLKFEGAATPPDREGNSLTAVRLHLLENGEMRPLKEVSLLADLRKSPSFDIAVPDTNARFVVRAKRIKLPG